MSDAIDLCLQPGPAPRTTRAPWRLAESIVVLRREVNAAAPHRNKASDGTIGDAAHAARNSDHNPWVKDRAGVGVVRAIDITHDPDGGMDAHALAEHIRRLGAAGDRRVRYVISNARIASPTQNWRWRPYGGSNPHRQHAHISVAVEQAGYDDPAPWGIHPPTSQQEDDMPLTDDDIKRIAEAVKHAVTPAVDQALQDDWALRDRVQAAQVADLRQRIDALAKRIS